MSNAANETVVAMKCINLVSTVCGTSAYFNTGRIVETRETILLQTRID